MAEAPGFFFNVEKFFGSVSSQRMSFAEKGVYLVMLFQQWREPSRNLPDDPKGVADLIAVTPAQAAEVEAAWDVVRRKFATSDHTPNRIWNVAIEKTRRAQRANFRNRSEAGRTAGKASAAKRKAAKELPVNERSTTVQRSSTVLVRIGEGSVGKGSEGKESSGTARSKRPIFSGQRLTVFEWMLDDCLKTLGPLADAFDLHDWFSTLDATAARTGMVIPQRDNGAWLQAQLLAEARNRGLPVATAGPAVGKQTTRLQSALANIKAEAR